MTTLKKVTLCILCFCFLICSSFFIKEETALPTALTADYKPTVIVDAGHGGFDGGAVANDGTPEKDINLSIALKLAELLKFHGYEVIMTRTEDTGTESDSAASSIRTTPYLSHKSTISSSLAGVP